MIKPAVLLKTLAVGRWRPMRFAELLGPLLLRACLLLLLSGCPGMLAIGTPCAWRAQVSAWFDDNGNGVLDGDEQPAPGVLIYGDHAGKPGWTAALVTDDHGQGQLYIVGCQQAAENGYGINALAPTGYQPTTPGRIAVPTNPEFSEGLVLKAPFAFGYRYDHQESPVVAPRTFTECQTFTDVSGRGGAMAGDGSLWTEYLDGRTDAGFRYGLQHLVPGQEAQKYSPPSELAKHYIYDLAVGADGAVWAATSNGVGRFRDGSWRYYTTEQGLPQGKGAVPERADEVAVAPDGSVWARVEDSIRWLDAPGERWLSCSDSGLPAPRGPSEFIQTGSGPLYLMTGGEKVTELTGRGQLSGDSRCLGQEAQLLGVTDILTRTNYQVVSAPDGAFWAYGSGQEPGPTLAHYDPSIARWRTYTYRSTGGALATHEIRALLPTADGSVWLGTQGQGVFHLTPDGETATVIHYAVGAGAAAQTISQILFTPEGAIWLGNEMEGHFYYCTGQQ